MGLGFDDAVRDGIPPATNPSMNDPDPEFWNSLLWFFIKGGAFVLAAGLVCWFFPGPPDDNDSGSYDLR